MSEIQMHPWVKQAKEWKPMKPCEGLKKAIEAVKLHKEPGHPIPGRIVRAYAQKFGVDADLIMLGVNDTFPWEKQPQPRTPR